MKGISKKAVRILAMCCAALLFFQSAAIDVQAATFYESDGQYHEEGYIFVGESHIANMATAVTEKMDAAGTIPGAEHIAYTLQWDASKAVTEKGDPNTFLMKGNLFFVWEGIAGSDATIQTNIRYIHSDGKGGRGRAVERIHEIINGNPNIAHWTIITFTGGVVAKSGAQGGRTHAQDYRNWIEYEFPNADIYVISQTTMTKYYRGMKDPEAYNRALAAELSDRFLDYTDFFKARYPQGMLDPKLVRDTVHWSHDTYFELFVDVIHEVDRRRAQAAQEGVQIPESADTQTADTQATQENVQSQENIQSQAYETVATEMVMYTNADTQLYREPLLESEIAVPVCEQGLPIAVNGITTTGFYRVVLAEETYYIPAAGLSVSVENS